MLRDGSVTENENEHTWLDASDGEDWREVDRALRGIGKQRSALDAAEAGWLRKAARVHLWRKVGCVSLLDYLERRCGHAPRTAQDRVRVAFALEDLPGLTAALATGEHPFSSIKELVRVVTPEHEAEWLASCRDKAVFEIQKMVSGRKKGSRPTDAPEPDLELRPLRFEEIKPATIALVRQARAKAVYERGEQVSDDALLATLASAFLEGQPTVEGTGRAKHQIAIVVCEKCNQGWQDGAGAKFAMDPTELARAECDAQRIGSLDTNHPTRATQDIPPSVRRLVWRRDGGTCTLSWCRSAASIEIHHIVAGDGRTHKPDGLTLLCDAHHVALHNGLITITGTAPNNLVVTRHDHASSAHVGTHNEIDRVTPTGLVTLDRIHAAAATRAVPTRAPAAKLEVAVIRAQAKDALVGLGWKPAIACAAIGEACGVLTTPTLEELIREALRRCPKPSARAP